jgi:hypothetical protein
VTRYVWFTRTPWADDREEGNYRTAQSAPSMTGQSRRSSRSARTSPCVRPIIGRCRPRSHEPNLGIARALELDQQPGDVPLTVASVGGTRPARGDLRVRQPWPSGRPEPRSRVPWFLAGSAAAGIRRPYAATLSHQPSSGSKREHGCGHRRQPRRGSIRLCSNRGEFGGASHICVPFGGWTISNAPVSDSSSNACATAPWSVGCPQRRRLGRS